MDGTITPRKKNKKEEAKNKKEEAKTTKEVVPERNLRSNVVTPNKKTATKVAAMPLRVSRRNLVTKEQQAIVLKNAQDALSNKKLVELLNIGLPTGMAVGV